ncbi:hypothetical protein [Actinocorallia populi]|uniref:hypothetical protein n=1 Tax=Actinocorallia populi TaxID=2079200 RepID=UPI000D09382A|nr:hypothetical protein [Actinocorallia populi]
MRTLLIAGLTTAALLAPAGTAAAQSVPSSDAIKLKASKELKKRLADTYYTSYAHRLACAERSKVVGPEDLHYGKIVAKGEPAVYWALGDIRLSCNPGSAQDGPHIWRKKGAAGHWVYRGDTGGSLCVEVPRKMLKAWGLGCTPT